MFAAQADTGFRRQMGEGAVAFELEVTEAPAADRAGTAVLRLTARSAVSGGTLEIVAAVSLWSRRRRPSSPAPCGRPTFRTRRQ